MANFAKDFQEAAPHTLATSITTFLQTAPAKTPVSIGYSITEGAYFALVVYIQ